MWTKCKQCGCSIKDGYFCDSCNIKRLTEENRGYRRDIEELRKSNDHLIQMNNEFLASSLGIKKGE